MTKKGATGDFFFHFCKQKRMLKKMDNIFLPNEKRCGIFFLRPPDWPQLRPPAGQETDYFCGQPHLRTQRLGMRDSNLGVLILNSLNYSINNRDMYLFRSLYVMHILNLKRTV